MPEGPSRTKILRRVNFGTRNKFGTEVPKRYGKGSQMLDFLDKRGQENGTDSEQLRQ